MAGGCAWQWVCVAGTCMAGELYMAGGMHGRGACMAGGHAWLGGMHGWGACMAGDMATAADSMHLTEMHSCL